jgi:hypothetical protein
MSVSNSPNDERNEKLFDAVLKIAAEEAVVERMEALPSREELAKLYPRSQVFDKKVAKIIGKHDKAEKKRKNAFVVRRFLKIAAAFLLAITVGFSLLLIDEDVRAAVRQTIIEWNEGFTRFIFQGNRHNVEMNISDFRLTYIPDGFAESGVFDTPAFVIIEFTSVVDEDSIITFRKAMADGLSTAVQNVYANSFTLENDGITYHVFASTRYYAPSQVIWEIDEFSFIISGELGPDTLIKMALSLEWND